MPTHLGLHRPLNLCKQADDVDSQIGYCVVVAFAALSRDVEPQLYSLKIEIGFVSAYEPYALSSSGPASELSAASQ